MRARRLDDVALDLMEDGDDIRTVQELLGPTDVSRQEWGRLFFGVLDQR